MLRTVRPHHIFSRVNQPENARSITLKLPSRRDLPLLETALLIAAARSVNAARIFEFGTYLGNTTLNFALASPPHAKVFTFDLDPVIAVGMRQHPEDAPITAQHFAAGTMAFEGSAVEHKITRLYGDSRTADMPHLAGSIDFVFVDGGHDLATVTADTENAFRMLRPAGCIAWHDYGNTCYPELTRYIEDLACTRDIVHVGDTMLAFWFTPSASTESTSR